MEYIIECYGIGILQILGGIFAITIWLSLFRQGDILQELVLQYLCGICG